MERREEDKRGQERRGQERTRAVQLACSTHATEVRTCTDGVQGKCVKKCGSGRVPLNLG